MIRDELGGTRLFNRRVTTTDGFRVTLTFVYLVFFKCDLRIFYDDVVDHKYR